jgi:glutathione peroxidase
MKTLVTSIIVMIMTSLPSNSSTERDFLFQSIDGGIINLEDFRGKAVLITNTASRCGFTNQYSELEDLHKSYKDKGLVVLALPSNDFNQELSSGSKVKEFCDVNFGLTMPMSDIISVKGKKAHPFYKWLKSEHKFQPNWNFYKVLIDRNGRYVSSFSSFTNPNSQKLLKIVDETLKQP